MQLATTYLDLLSKVADPKETAKLRAKFQTLIIKSSLVRPEYLLSRLEKTDMHQEMAILHGKVKDIGVKSPASLFENLILQLGDHDQALKIFVEKLEDFDAAENYCDKIAPNKGSHLRETLLHSLMRIYLDPELECVRFNHTTKPLGINGHFF